MYVHRREACVITSNYYVLTYNYLICVQVLQMIGRAGRPGFDTHADAVVMVRAEMKEYYKRVSESLQCIGRGIMLHISHLF